MQFFKEKIIIENIGKKSILADVSFYDRSSEKPVVIFCHGYKGFKDWGAWNLVANEFALEGFVFLKFNFSHNGGTIENPIDFPDLDAFGKNTYSKEIEDLKRVLDYCENKLGDQQIYLIGHSRGGGIVSLVGGQDKRVAKVVSWAGVSDFKRRFPSGEQLQIWKSNGVRYVENARTKQQMPHYYSFYEDFVENETNLTIEKWVREIKVPHLIVHGTNDEAVLIDEAFQLKEWNPKAVMYTLDANHTFDSMHPLKDAILPSKLKEVVGITIKFLKDEKLLHK